MTCQCSSACAAKSFPSIPCLGTKPTVILPCCIRGFRKKHTKEAWETGIADMRWKCWACLAHSHNSDYETMCEIAAKAQWTPAAVEQRTTQRRKYDPNYKKGSETWRYQPGEVERARRKRLWDLMVALERKAQGRRSERDTARQWDSRWDWSTWAESWDHGRSSGSQPSNRSDGASHAWADRSRSRGSASQSNTRLGRPERQRHSW